ncbi:putative F-box protein At5g55150 isoform X2 [Tasmannia lanceolata]|uniref:putative F-box protein At5g55150 isoform X2 n=1 Tax=Tasmannia lanceolata TaxID=3420 RepID=UPI00406443B7
MAIRGGLPLPPLSLSPPVKSLKFSALTSLSFSPSIMRFARLSLLNSSKAFNPIKTKKIHISSDTSEQSELPNRSVSHHQLPLLMLSGEEHTKFFSLFEKKPYDIQIPEFHRKWCCGSSMGWVVTVDDSSNVHLINPLSKTQIQLPSLDKLMYPRYSFLREIPRECIYINKIILSADPISTPDYIVVMIVGGHSLFSFYKPGDEGWTTLEIPWGPLNDVIYYKGQFCCITKSCCILACDFASNGLPKFTKITRAAGLASYIVESSGELLEVSKWNGKKGFISYFNVFQLDQSTGKWIELESLGDQVLFLGFNCSISLSALDFPQLKANCIYYADNDIYVDCGIYNLKDGSIKDCYPHPLCWIERPIWLAPCKSVIID